MDNKEITDIENCIHNKVYKLGCTIVALQDENKRLKEEIEKAYGRMDALEQSLKGKDADDSR